MCVGQGGGKEEKKEQHPPCGVFADVDGGVGCRADCRFEIAQSE
jgi:hypothetical protein